MKRITHWSDTRAIGQKFTQLEKKINPGLVNLRGSWRCCSYDRYVERYGQFKESIHVLEHYGSNIPGTPYSTGPFLISAKCWPFRGRCGYKEIDFGRLLLRGHEGGEMLEQI